MATQAGAVEVGLRVRALRRGYNRLAHDFPGWKRGNCILALVRESAEYCIYSFILMAPPVPLEQLEGALNQQAHILRDELTKLNAVLSEA